MPPFRNAVQGLELAQRASLQRKPASQRRPPKRRPGRQLSSCRKVARTLVGREAVQGDVLAPALEEAVEIGLVPGEWRWAL
eukprot:11236550-Alexandrium_andersonii.AAC.1